MAPIDDWRQGLKNAIWGATSDNQVRQAMLMGAQLESGMNPTRVGDNGHSFGVFQIYLVAHPDMTAAKAASIPEATRFMLPAYQAAVRKVPDGLWNSNPALASATAAFYAERPQVMYPSSRITSGWPIVLSMMQGAAVPGTVVGADQPGGVKSQLPDWLTNFITPINLDLTKNPLGGITDFFSAIGQFVTGIFKIVRFFSYTLFLPKTWARVAAFSLGSALVIAGLFVFFVGGSPVKTVLGAIK